MMSDIFNLNVNELTTVGNVGIGTTSPSAKLEVNSGTSTGPTLRLATTGITVSSNTEIGTLDFYNSDATAPGARTASYISSYSAGTAGGGDLRFATSENANTVTERMRIDDAGNVGIGTSTVTDKLQVQTSSSGATPVLLSLVNNTGVSANATGAKLWMSGRADSATNRGVYLEAITTNTNNAHDLAFATSASAGSPTERLRITSTGNVGIGTTDQFGGGVKVVGIANATTVPASNPTGGGVLYVEGGALKYRGSSGTVTTIANA
jgi:hypothetical protein